MIEVHFGGLPPDKVPFLGPIIAQAMESTDPNQAQALMGGLLGNIVGHISDEFWAEMVNESLKPCDQPGCKCHEYHEFVYQALSKVRDDWKRVTDRKSPENPDEKGFSK